MKKGFFYFYCFLAFIAATAAHADIFKVGDLIDDVGITLPVEAGFINLRVDNNHFNLYFLDKDKQVVKCPVQGATVQFAESKKRSKKYISVMEAATEACLVGKRVVKRPYDYVVTVFVKENSKATTQNKASNNSKAISEQDDDSEAPITNQNALVSAVRLHQI
jgi:hypothetical protein